MTVNPSERIMPYTYILQDLGIDIICFICEKSKFGCPIFTHMGLIVFNYKVHLHYFSTVKTKTDYPTP